MHGDVGNGVESMTTYSLGMTDSTKNNYRFFLNKRHFTVRTLLAILPFDGLDSQLLEDV